MIARARHPGDHRKQIVTITEAGRALLEQVHVEYASLVASTLGGLTLEERETLAGLLEKLTGSIYAAYHEDKQAKEQKLP